MVLLRKTEYLHKICPYFIFFYLDILVLLMACQVKKINMQYAKFLEIQHAASVACINHLAMWEEGHSYRTTA